MGVEKFSANAVKLTLSIFNEPKVKEKKFMNIKFPVALNKSSLYCYMINNWFTEHILNAFTVDKINPIGFRFFLVAYFGSLCYLLAWHVGISYGFAPARAVCFGSPLDYRMPYSFSINFRTFSCLNLFNINELYQ